MLGTLTPSRPRGISCLRLAAAAVMLAAGCASLQWHKPGTDAAALAHDLAECRHSGRTQAQTETLPRAFTSPTPFATTPRAQPVVIGSNQRDADILLLEQDLTRACMEGKGYKLAPKTGDQ